MKNTNNEQHFLNEQEIHCADKACSIDSGKTPEKKGGIAGKLLTLLALAVLGGLGLNYFQGNQATDFEVQQALIDGIENINDDGSVVIGDDGKPVETGKNYKWECTDNGWVDGREADETGDIFFDDLCDDSIVYNVYNNCTTTTNTIPSSRSCPGGTNGTPGEPTGGPIDPACDNKDTLGYGHDEPIVQLVFSCTPVTTCGDLSYCYGDFLNNSIHDNLNYSGTIEVVGGSIVNNDGSFAENDGYPNQAFIHADAIGNCTITDTGISCDEVTIGAYENLEPSPNRPAGMIDDYHNFGFYVKQDNCEDTCAGLTVIGEINGNEGTNINGELSRCPETITPDTCPVDPTSVTCCDGSIAATLSACLVADYNGTASGCGTQGTSVTCCDGTTASTLSECPTDNNGSAAGCEHGSGATPGCTDTAAYNYDHDAGSNDGSCRYSGCSDSQCKIDFTTPQEDACTSNAECIPNAVCDGTMDVVVNQPIACGEEGTIDVTVANVNTANVSIVCDGDVSFGTQSADMDMFSCTDSMQSIYDTITANLNEEALGVIHGNNNQLENNNIATALADEYGFVPYDVLQAISACGVMPSFATQQAADSHDLMAHCNVFGDCSEWTVNLTHEVTRHWYFKLYDSENTLVGEGEGPQSSAANNYYSGPWLTQPAPGLITVKLYLNADGTGPHKTLTFDAPTNCGACDDTFPIIDPDTICEGESETVTNDCGSTLTVNGTKTGGACETCDEAFDTPDLTEICEGDSVQVRNECGDVKTVRGTKDCGGVCTANPTTIIESFPIPAGATSCVVTVNYGSTTCKDCEESTTVTITPDETNAPGTTCDDGDDLTTDDAINEDCVCEGTPLDPVDCEVSEFSEWVCDEETDVRSRSRTITVQPANGGAECPVLEQEKPCLADDYDLALNKTVVPSENGYYTPGDEVTFNIRVHNQGDVVASGIEVVDYIPEGLTFVESNRDHSIDGDKIYLVVPGSIEPDATKNIRVTFMIDTDFDGLRIENFAEISADDGDDCDSTADDIMDNDGTVDDNAIGDGCNEGGDEDDHDIAIIKLEICNGLDDNGNGDTDEGFDDMEPGMTCDDGDANTANDVYNEMCVCAGINIVDEDEYDLALMKDLADGQSRTVAAGDEVTFTITITNQGDITANNYELVDHLPAGLTLNDADWTDLGSNDATIALSTVLAPGASTTVDITTTVDAGVNGELINVVEISSDDGDDVDSAVSNDNGDQSEDDEDAEPLNVVSGEVCDGVDNNGNGTVDEGFEDMAEGTSCDDGRARTYNDTYNDVCECVGIVASGGSGGGNNYCGDGVVRTGEECDDGNYDNGDGCNSNCEIEGFCGDGLMNVVGEQCDDGNITSNDGCSATCLTEIILVCGDSAINQEWEDCDDGNTIDGDGCSATCQLEIEDDIVSQILEMKKEPVVVPPRVITPLALPIELPQTGADLTVSMCIAK